MTPHRRTFAALLLGTALLGGCASLGTLQADLATYGDWPAGRAPGRYAFDRLPSQAAQPEQQQRLEAAARPALAAAGFSEAAAGEVPQVLVQLGARVTRYDRSPWDDPLWWRGGFGIGRHGPWIGAGWSFWARGEPPRYEREVALLLRDRDSGAPLFEARATTDGLVAGSDALLAAMFRAALADFPRQGPNPRAVSVPLPP